jgi:hypothetical protein
MNRLRTILLFCLVFVCGPAQADSRSFSYSIWDVVGSTVHVRFMMPIAEARNLADPGAPVPAIEEVKMYVAEHVAVTALGVACQPVDQGEEVGLINTLSLLPGWYRFEVIFQCASPNDIILQDTVLFDRVPDHINFARVQVEGGGFAQRLFTADDQHLRAASGDIIFGESGILRYVRLGFAHILRRVDRIAFFVGLMLVARWWRDYATIVAGLCLGYTVSLAVLLTGVIIPRMDLVEALVGFMSVFIAAQMITVASQRPEIAAITVGLGLLVAAASASTLDASAKLLLSGFGLFSACYLFVCERIADRAAFWLLPTALFALLDGFGLAGAVSGFEEPGRRLAPVLVGFDCGAMFAEITALATIAAGVALVNRSAVSLPRPFATDLGAATLAGLGVFWFVFRVFS